MSVQWAVVNLVNANMGLACMYMPRLGRTGASVGVLVILSAAGVVSYVSHLTGLCQVQLLASSFPELVEEVYGFRGRALFYCFYCVQVLLELLIYQQFVRYCVEVLSVPMHCRGFVSLCIPFVASLCTMHATLLYVSNIASALCMALLYSLFVAVLAVIAIACKHPNDSSMQPNDSSVAWWEVTQYFGLSVFAMRNSHLCIPTLLNAIDHQSFPTVIVASFVIVVLGYSVLIGSR
jgi:hypothetical protein